MNAVHVDVWSHGKGCEKKKKKNDFTNVQLVL